MVGEKGEMTTTPLEPEKHSLLSNSFSPKGHQSNESRGLMYSLLLPAENPIFTLVERGPPLRLFCCAASNAMIAFHMLSNWLEKGEQQSKLWLLYFSENIICATAEIVRGKGK